MRRTLVRSFVASLGLLPACDNSNTLVLEPNPAVRVVIDTSRCPRVERCGQCLLGFNAFDKNGQPALFPTLLWSSSNPARATVDDAGRVTGWRIGSVTIRVEVQETGATDDVVLNVVEDPNASCTPP